MLFLLVLRWLGSSGMLLSGETSASHRSNETGASAAPSKEAGSDSVPDDDSVTSVFLCNLLVRRLLMCRTRTIVCATAEQKRSVSG